MNKVFLEMAVDKSIFLYLKKYQLPVPVFEENETSTIIFNTVDDYCRCLTAVEKVSADFLSEYWLFKTPELIEKNRCIIRVLTILNEAGTKTHPEFVHC